jgi:hypothetical protein
MRIVDVVWEIIDNGLYVLHLVAVLFIGLSAVACPIWLGMIHAELVAIRQQNKPCECKRDEGPGPVLPRVLPRLRRIGEEAAE